MKVWPFADTSIWNTPIGSGAVYSPALIIEDHNPYNVFGDDDYFIVTTEEDPMIDWYNQGWWNSTPNCDIFPWTPLVCVIAPAPVFVRVCL